jgi:PAS domain S-box-containing protein
MMQPLERQTSIPGSNDVLLSPVSECPPFELTVERAPVGIAHFDPSGRFLFVNPQLCALLGLTRDELLAKTFQEISFADDLPRCLAMTRRLAAGEIPRYTLEKRFTRSDGSLVPTRVMVTMVRGTGAEPSFFIGIVEDLSEQREADEARRAAEERLELALDASGTGIYRFDFASEAVEWSNGIGRLYGFHEGDRLQSLERFVSAVHPDDREQVLAAYERSAKHGHDFDEEFRIILPDGSVRWISDRARTTLDAAGRPKYLTGACVDVTKRREAETARAQMRERERAARADTARAMALRDEVLAIVAHDLRNPLHAVLLGIELVQRSALGMDALIRDLLDSTHIEIGSLPVIPAAMSVRTVVDHTLATSAKQALERGLALEADVPGDLPDVRADRNRILQVLDNLVGNAMKFTPSSGRITIRARRLDDGVELAVVDTGRGIGPNELPHVFDRYWQGERGAREGVGLGLAIVRGLVEAHGSHVEVESKVGEGSTFRFKLPVYESTSPNG